MTDVEEVVCMISGNDQKMFETILLSLQHTCTCMVFDNDQKMLETMLLSFQHT